MEFIHEPVLLQEVLEWMDVKPDGVYCDCLLYTSPSPRDS